MASTLAGGKKLQNPFRKALETLYPLFFENEHKVFGLCVVCGKKGVLGRCLRCGILMQYTCVLPEQPGAEQKCPVCHRVVQDDGDEYPHLMDVGAPPASSARKKTWPSLTRRLPVE